MEEFFTDFKEACEYVMKKNYPDNDKMKKDFLEVPGIGFNDGTNIETGITSSLAPYSGSTSN